MFSSLRARLWLTYALLIGAALLLVFALLLAALVRSPLLYRSTVERINLAADLARARYAEGRGTALLRRLDEDLNVRLLIVDAEGEQRYDSRPSAPPLLGVSAPREEARLPTLRDAAGGRWLFTARPLPEGGWVFAVAPRPTLTVLLRVVGDDLRAPFVRVGLLALLVSLGVAWLVARGVADPLQGMVQAATLVPERWPDPVPERGPREVREVIRAFNAMAARVQASQQAQRDFVANVSHELKTPLTSIQGFAQAILDGTAEDPQTQRRAAGIIRDEAARMHRLVRDLLDLARMDAGIARFERRPLALEPVLQAVVDKMSPQAEAAGVALRLETADLPRILGDGDRLAQVFTNLVDNAIHHTPPGGEVSVYARAVEGGVQVRVRDTGEGIPPQALPHVFERFYRADAARGHQKLPRAGLGLSIARDIVHAHGGKINVHSAPGKGSEFIVLLPLAASSTRKRPTHP